MKAWDRASYQGVGMRRREGCKDIALGPPAGVGPGRGKGTRKRTRKQLLVVSVCKRVVCFVCVYDGTVRKRMEATCRQRFCSRAHGSQGQSRETRAWYFGSQHRELWVIRLLRNLRSRGLNKTHRGWIGQGKVYAWT